MSLDLQDSIKLVETWARPYYDDRNHRDYIPSEIEPIIRRIEAEADLWFDISTAKFRPNKPVSADGHLLTTGDRVAFGSSHGNPPKVGRIIDTVVRRRTATLIVDCDGKGVDVDADKVVLAEDISAMDRKSDAMYAETVAHIRESVQAATKSMPWLAGSLEEAADKLIREAEGDYVEIAELIQLKAYDHPKLANAKTANGVRQAVDFLLERHHRLAGLED